MKIIEYAPDGEAIADAVAESRARVFLQTEGDAHIKVSTDNFVLASRVLIHERFIAHTDVQYLFNGKTMLANADGRMIDPWPYGWCDYADRWLNRILTRIKE